MNAALNLIFKLNELRVKLSVNENNDLVIRDSENALTPALINQIKTHKADILNTLKSNARYGNRVNAISRVSRELPLKLSSSQQRLWLLDKIDGGSTHYNMPASIKLTGTLNFDALRYAFIQIIERHEVLRTTLSAGEDGQPIQFIRPGSDFDIPVSDLSSLSLSARETRLAELVAMESHKPFDLSADLMLRANLIRLSNDDNVLLVTMHHIASDGHSMGILVKEFSALYDSFVNGKKVFLTPLKIQYADYAH